MKRVIGILLILCSCAVSAEPKPDLTPLRAAPATIGLTGIPPTLPTTTSLAPSTTQVSVPEPLNISVEELVADARSNYGVCGEWHDLALSVGWPESEWPRLAYILYRESRCTPSAWNGADAGLSQINRIHKEWLSQMGWSYPDDMFDPKNNLTFAYRLWTTSGWKPWGFDDDFVPPAVGN